MLCDGQQLSQYVDFMIRQDSQCATEPLIRFDVVGFSSSHQGVDHSSALSGIMRTSKEIVFSTHGDRAYGILYRVIVDLQLAMAGYMLSLSQRDRL